MVCDVHITLNKGALSLGRSRLLLMLHLRRLLYRFSCHRLTLQSSILILPLIFLFLLKTYSPRLSLPSLNFHTQALPNVCPFSPSFFRLFPNRSSLATPPSYFHPLPSFTYPITPFVPFLTVSVHYQPFLRSSVQFRQNGRFPNKRNCAL